MGKIIFIYLILVSVLLSQTFECILYDVQNVDTNTSNYVYDKDIKMYFELQKKQLTVIMLTDTKKLTYIETMKNIENEQVDVYSEVNFTAAVYSNFKSGVRLITDSMTYDVADCREVK